MRGLDEGPVPAPADGNAVTKARRDRNLSPTQLSWVWKTVSWQGLVGPEPTPCAFPFRCFAFPLA